MTMFRNLGLALGVVRQMRGRSQAAVARQARVGKSQLSKYEKGKELPRLESLERVLMALEVGSFEFFYILHLLDRGEHEIAGAAEAPGEPPAYAGSGGSGGSIDQGFQRVVNDLFTLYGQVFTVRFREGRREDLGAPSSP
jgi:transcriptional regulator with XRE-family HTH domain